MLIETHIKRPYIELSSFTEKTSSLRIKILKKQFSQNSISQADPSRSFSVFQHLEAFKRDGQS